MDLALSPRELMLVDPSGSCSLCVRWGYWYLQHEHWCVWEACLPVKNLSALRQVCGLIREFLVYTCSEGGLHSFFWAALFAAAEPQFVAGVNVLSPSVRGILVSDLVFALNRGGCYATVPAPLGLCSSSPSDCLWFSSQVILQVLSTLGVVYQACPLKSAAWSQCLRHFSKQDPEQRLDRCRITSSRWCLHPGLPRYSSMLRCNYYCSGAARTQP